MKNPTEYQVLMTGLRDTHEAPRDRNIFYRCRICDTLVPSIPKEAVWCKCRNILIDTDYFRLAVKDMTQFEAVRKLRRTKSA
jgi:hypothetical protein